MTEKTSYASRTFRPILIFRKKAFHLFSCDHRLLPAGHETRRLVLASLLLGHVGGLLLLADSLLVGGVVRLLGLRLARLRLRHGVGLRRLAQRRLRLGLGLHVL